MDGHSSLVARRNHLHRGILQGQDQADLRQGRVAEGSGPASSTRVSMERYAARSTFTKEKQSMRLPSRRSFARRSPSTVPASLKLQRKRSPEGFRDRLPRGPQKATMRTAAAALLLLTWTPGSVAYECPDFAGRDWDFVGHLVANTFPGPPDYESVTSGDRPVNRWYLQLAYAACFSEYAHQTLLSTLSGAGRIRRVSGVSLASKSGSKARSRRECLAVTRLHWSSTFPASRNSGSMGHEGAR